MGYEPKRPERKIDLDYMEHLVRSYERWEQMECYNDLMSRIKDAQQQLSRKWLNGQKTTPQEQGAAMAFDGLLRLVEFNKKRLQVAIKQQYRGINHGAASERQDHSDASERLRERLKKQ